MKQCSRCKKTKPGTDFLMGFKRCDLCTLYCRQNPSPESKRKYYERNKELVKQRSHDRYHANREECLRKIKEQWQKKDPTLRWATRTIYSHKRRGIVVSVTREELIDIMKQTTHCWLCKKELEQYSHDSKRWPSVDRIDNSKGLVLGNIHIICLQCNSRKRTMPLRKFAQLV